ncbi:HIRAN domain-containing protein [Enterococcus massiliensis]|uniref:HIRAN domain-containing protein n=1 Tax=Enterococcus massiliensis TaxID=1640685 RepID=UPI00065E7580|nr:HIRAN domain-containing protein [Enterococcus massiliensis]
MVEGHYERSRFVIDFHLAAFAYYDGLMVIDELSLGQVVELKPEPDNPHDPNAVAIYYKEHKIGYVPEAKNDFLSTMLYFGHGDIFEARIQAMNLQQHPERQFRVVIYVKDGREKTMLSE